MKNSAGWDAADCRLDGSGALTFSHPSATVADAGAGAVLFAVDATLKAFLSGKKIRSSEIG